MTKSIQIRKKQNEKVFDELCQHILDALKCFCSCVKNKEDKKKCIKCFQRWLCCRLNGSIIDYAKFCDIIESGKELEVVEGEWEIEYKKPNSVVKDSVDIINTLNNWIIEIDTTRADQVAKKAFSRIALYGTGKKPIFYVAIMYPGTDKMNVNEVIKYSLYGYDIVKKMNNNNDFRTIIINCEAPNIKVVRFDKLRFSVNGNNEKTMSDAVKKAIEIYLSRPSKNYNTLEKALRDYNNNHNGLQTIVSKGPLSKNPIVMKDKDELFYVTKQWSFKGYTANFQEIINFFKTYNIYIEPISQVISY